MRMAVLTSVIEDDWLKALGLEGLNEFSKIAIELAGTISEKRLQINPPSVGKCESG